MSSDIDIPIPLKPVGWNGFTDGLLNRAEMAFRAYDPCHACATHTLPGQMPLIARIRDCTGSVIAEYCR